MPPRWVSAAIIVGWIASVVWLFRLEIWPSLEPGAPPPFTIDLVEEAQTSKLPISWRVTQNGNYTLNAKTSVEHRVKENDFTLRAVFTPPPFLNAADKQAAEAEKISIRHMSSAYRVTPEGQLLDLKITMNFVYRPKKLDCDMRSLGRGAQRSIRAALRNHVALSLELHAAAGSGVVARFGGDAVASGQSH